MTDVYDKCIVFGCKNHKYQGSFVDNMCMPCHSMIVSGEPKFGQTFVHEMQARIKELEENINLKSDWIHRTMSGMGADAQRIAELEAAEMGTNLFFGLSLRKFTEKEISEIAAYVSTELEAYLKLNKQKEDELEAYFKFNKQKGDAQDRKLEARKMKGKRHDR